MSSPHTTSAKREVPYGQGPSKDHGSYNRVFRCSLMLSEPYCEHSIIQNGILKNTVAQNLEGARTCCTPPESATVISGHALPIVQKTITIGLSASITFEIVNQSEYALGI